MEIDEDTIEKINRYQLWHDGYLQGCEDAERRNDYLVEDLMREISQLKAQLSEFKNSNGEWIS